MSGIWCCGHERSIETNDVFSFHAIFCGLLDAGGSRISVHTVVAHHFVYELIAFVDAPY